MYKIYINDTKILENIEKLIKNNNISPHEEYKDYLYSIDGVFYVKKHKNVNKIIKLKLMHSNLSQNIINYFSNYEDQLLLDDSSLIESNEIYNLPEEYYETKIKKTKYLLDENIYFIKINEKYINNNSGEINYYYFEVNNINNITNIQRINKIINN